MHSTPSLPLDRCGSSVENRPVDLSGPPSPTPHHLTTPPVLFLSSHEPRGTRLVFRAVNLRRAGRQRVASWTTSKTQFAISRRAEKKNTGPLPPLPPPSIPLFPRFRRVSGIPSRSGSAGRFALRPWLSGLLREAGRSQGVS